MSEKNLLEKLNDSFTSFCIPQPIDLIDTLATNKNGYQWKNRDATKLKGLVFHQELAWGDIESVAKYHTGPNSHLGDGDGVESIAYTLAIRRDGQIILCNSLSKATWSQGDRSRPGDENKEFMAVMFEGMFTGYGYKTEDSGEPNDVQMLSGLILWQVCKELWGWKAKDLYGHYHFSKPACPGNALKTIIEAVRYNMPKGVLTFGNGNVSVKEKQTALSKLSYLNGPIDGIWGNQSRAALIKFQQENGLLSDGIWGPMTDNKITEIMTKHV